MSHGNFEMDSEYSWVGTRFQSVELVVESGIYFIVEREYEFTYLDEHYTMYECMCVGGNITEFRQFMRVSWAECEFNTSWWEHKYKTRFTIPKGQSEPVDRRTDNTMPNRKMMNIDIQNTTQKTKDRATRTQVKTGGLTQVFWKGYQFLLDMRHPSY